MLEPAVNLGQVSDRLCAEAARLHKAISAMTPNYGDPARLGLTHRLVGIRTALCLLHGGDPDPAIPSSDPAGAVLTDWWRHDQPEDWAGEVAVRARYAEQLYFAMHQLLMASEHVSAAAFARATGIPDATAYFVLGNPARSRWRTLVRLVKALGGHHDELWGLWHKAHKRPSKTIPPPRAGRGLTPVRTGW